MTVLVLGAGHLERQRIGRRRAVLLDVVAVRIARAADERAEPAALADERALAALRADLTGPLLGRRLVARQRPALLVLGIQRAGQEPAVPTQPDDHRVALRAHLVGRLGREVAALELAALLVDAVAQRAVEGAQQRHPLALATGDLVELLLHPRGELDVDVVAEVLDEQVGHDLGDELGMEPAVLDPDVAAVGDRRDRRRVRRRAADPVLLERLDQRGLRIARRRLGEVLGRGHLGHARPIAFDQGRQATGRLVVLGHVVVAALGVDPGEAVEQDPGRRRAQLVRTVGQVDRRGLELLGRHLRGERALPDQPVQAQLLRRQRARDRIRVAPEARRADRLVGFLGTLRLRLVDATLGHRELGPVALADDLARLAHGDPRDRRRIGSHVGDQADLALGRRDPFVQPLGDRHRPLRPEAEATARFLLQGRGRERRRGRTLLGARADLGHVRMESRDRGAMTLGGLRVADVEGGSVDPHHLGREALAGGRVEQRLDRPVLAGAEGADLALALDDEADRDGLHATG